MMFVLAITGFIGTLPSLINLGCSNSELIDKALDLITVAVPPALPLALSIGINHSLKRLNNHDYNIRCTSPHKIIQGGLIDAIVFDKTGTLTEDKLNIDKIICYNNNDY